MATSFKIKDGKCFVVIESPGGIFSAEQLTSIIAASKNFDSHVKITEDQGIGLFLEESKTQELAALLKDIGLTFRPYQTGLHEPVSCIGGLCPKMNQDALACSIKLSQSLKELQLDAPFKIGINGCAQSCVPTHTLDISLIGEKEGYSLRIGGKNSHIAEFASFAAEGIPEDKVPEKIKGLIDVYKSLVKDSETLQEVIERCGMKPFIDALAPYSQDASADIGDIMASSAEPSTPSPVAAATDPAAAQAPVQAPVEQENPVASESELEEKITQSMDQVKKIENLTDQNKEARAQAFEGLTLKSASKPQNQNNDGKAWSLSGFNMTPAGDMILEFSSGVCIGLNPALLGEGGKSFHVGDKQIEIRQEGSSYILSLDGITLSFPKR